MSPRKTSRRARTTAQRRRTWAAARTTSATPSILLTRATRAASRASGRASGRALRRDPPLRRRGLARLEQAQLAGGEWPEHGYGVADPVVVGDEDHLLA